MGLAPFKRDVSSFQATLSFQDYICPPTARYHQVGLDVFHYRENHIADMFVRKC